MKHKFISTEFTYDGSQLRSLFAYMEHGLMGNSIVAWVGPCNIPEDKIVDGEDLRAQEKICGSKMLHFIVEVFDQKLFSGVLMQRLLASTIFELLAVESPNRCQSLTREGDDLYYQSGKLSISIATKSPVSTLVHFAVNVKNEGTPVNTSCLEDLGVDPQTFATQLMIRFSEEIKTSLEATTKVFSVK